jgi:hypothetical protein
MEANSLARDITEELEFLRQAIVRRDADAIEECAAHVKDMLDSLGQQLATERVHPREAFREIGEAARKCGALLRRGQLALMALQNLHDLFSSDDTYCVRG